MSLGRLGPRTPKTGLMLPLYIWFFQSNKLRGPNTLYYREEDYLILEVYSIQRGMEL